MSTFSYSIEQLGDRPVAKVEGEIDLAAVDGFEGAIDALTAEAGDRDALLDMADVTFLDSSGLRVLMKAHQRWTDAGSTLTIRNPSSAVSRILEITGLLDKLDLE
ncbi:MAG TPA: STAS domain-containing protein [Acidimicrobiia bacterium]